VIKEKKEKQPIHGQVIIQCLTQNTTTIQMCSHPSNGTSVFYCAAAVLLFLLTVAATTSIPAATAAKIPLFYEGVAPGNSSVDWCANRLPQWGNCVQGYALLKNTVTNATVLWFTFSQTIGGDPAENAQTWQSLQSWEYEQLSSHLTMPVLVQLLNQAFQNASLYASCNNNCYTGNRRVFITTNWNSILARFQTSLQLSDTFAITAQQQWYTLATSVQTPYPGRSLLAEAVVISLSTVLPFLFLSAMVYLAYKRKWYEECCGLKSMRNQLRLKSFKDLLEIHTLWTVHHFAFCVVNVIQLALSADIVAHRSEYDSSLVQLCIFNLVEHILHILNYVGTLYHWGGIRLWDANSTQCHKLHYAICAYTASMAIYGPTVASSTNNSLNFYFIVVYDWIHFAMQAGWLYQVRNHHDGASSTNNHPHTEAVRIDPSNKHHTKNNSAATPLDALGQTLQLLTMGAVEVNNNSNRDENQKRKKNKKTKKRNNKKDSDKDNNNNNNAEVVQATDTSSDAEEHKTHNQKPVDTETEAAEEIQIEVRDDDAGNEEENNNYNGDDRKNDKEDDDDDNNQSEKNNNTDNDGNNADDDAEPSKRDSIEEEQEREEEKEEEEEEPPHKKHRTKPYAIHHHTK
jgi:hypothetical protein